MEKQSADRDKRAAILTAEGEKQSQILNAEVPDRPLIFRAEGEAQAMVIRAETKLPPSREVFKAVHDGNADEKVLAYGPYLEQLPAIANGSASKVWVILTELSATATTIVRASKNSGQLRSK